MKKKIRTGILILTDIILIYFSILLAFILRLDGQLNKLNTTYIYELVYILMAAGIVKISFVLLFKLYNSLWKYAGISEMLSVVKAVFCANAIMFVASVIFRTGIPRSIFVITLFTDIILIGGIRFGYRILRRTLASNAKRYDDDDPQRVLIVGGGEAGATIIKELSINTHIKRIPAAIIDDDQSIIGKRLNGVPVVGDRSCIADVVGMWNIDEIIIAIPSASKRDINEIFIECTKTHCKVKILPSVSQLIDGSISIKKVRDVNIEDLLGREPVKLDIDKISSYLKDRVVLITGGGGSIGSELCRQIAKFSPRQLIILDNYENNAYEIQNELRNKYKELNLVTVIANIRERSRLDNIFSKYMPDVVFHAAAHKHVSLMEENPTEAVKNNVFGTMNVAECADKYKTKRFVLISTDKAVNPTSIMGATKRIAEMIVQTTGRHSKTEFVAVRFGNVLGSNGSVIPLFKKQIEQGGPVTVTHPEVTRFFMTIPEAVQLVIQAGAMAKGGEIFVLDMGESVKIYDLARNLIKLSGFKPDEDIKIEFTGLRAGEKLYEELLLAEEDLKSTANEKIFIAPPVFSDARTLMKEIDLLKEVIVKNTDDVQDYIPKLVPAYKRA